MEEYEKRGGVAWADQLRTSGFREEFERRCAEAEKLEGDTSTSRKLIILLGLMPVPMLRELLNKYGEIIQEAGVDPKRGMGYVPIAVRRRLQECVVEMIGPTLAQTSPKLLTRMLTSVNYDGVLVPWICELILDGSIRKSFVNSLPDLWTLKGRK